MSREGRMHCNLYRHHFGKSGFTLLEVMIAIALIAIGFVTLLGSQSRSLSRVTEAKFNTLAPILASGKLAEIESGKVPLFDTTGDFGADFPAYTWRLDVEDVDAKGRKIPAIIAAKLQRVSLAVSWGETKFLYTLTTYVPRKD